MNIKRYKSKSKYFLNLQNPLNFLVCKQFNIWWKITSQILLSVTLRSRRSYVGISISVRLNLQSFCSWMAPNCLIVLFCPIEVQTFLSGIFLKRFYQQELDKTSWADQKNSFAAEANQAVWRPNYFSVLIHIAQYDPFQCLWSQ